MYSNVPPLSCQNFLFEFQEAPQVLFDKVIEIKVSSTLFQISNLTFFIFKQKHCQCPAATCSQVFHRRILAFLMTHIGTFKIDINTIYNQTGDEHS